MVTKKKLQQTLTENGYIQYKYGYKKITKNNTHWITDFEDGSFQMYAYYTQDNLGVEKVYDTGIINEYKLTNLVILIKLFTNNHK